MTDDSRWFVLLNPAAGGGRARRHWPRLREALRRRGVAHEFAATRMPGDAQSLVRQAITAGHRRLLALGGDGSLHDLINGMMSQCSVPPAEVTVAVAPLGTGNDWAATMQVPRDPERLAAALASARTRRVDLGIAECHSDDGSPRRAWFHNAAGAGLDAHVLARMPRRGPRPLAYLAGLVRGLASFRAPEFSVEADSEPRGGRCFLAIGAIGPRCGGGMRLAPDALPDDGILEVVMVGVMPLARALRRLPSLYDGSLTRDPAVIVRRCSQARIDAEPAAAVQADGQLLGRTPLAMRVLPGALTALDCRIRDNP